MDLHTKISTLDTEITKTLNAASGQSAALTSSHQAASMELQSSLASAQQQIELLGREKQEYVS